MRRTKARYGSEKGPKNLGGVEMTKENMRSGVPYERAMPPQNYTLKYDLSTRNDEALVSFKLPFSHSAQIELNEKARTGARGMGPKKVRL